jgi:hypothetical protein
LKKNGGGLLHPLPRGGNVNKLFMHVGLQEFQELQVTVEPRQDVAGGVKVTFAVPQMDDPFGDPHCYICDINTELERFHVQTFGNHPVELKIAMGGAQT